MGLMHPFRALEDAGQLVITPDPVTLEGQSTAVCDLVPGETLFEFLTRHVDPREPWEVTIGGVIVPVEHWDRIRPKHGQVIHVRGAVGRQAVMLVAMIALNYFTFGAASIVGIGGAYAGVGAYVAAGAIYVAGAALINHVLTPELPKPESTQRDSVHAIGAARNAVRLYQPLGLLLGHTRITPDYASAPYTWYEGNDMLLGMVLNVGINVQDVGELYNADTLLSSYEGVEVFYSGIPGKPDQVIPLYSNADTINGGALDADQTWVVRTTPPDTVRVQVNVEGTIGDRDSKGRDHPNSEVIEAHYRRVGDTVWQGMVSRLISNANDKNFELQRVTMSRNLPRGQYEIRVKRHFTAKDPSKGNWSADSEFQWTNMVAVQADEADYAGMGRIGIRIKATGQLTGAMDQLRLEAWSRPVPVWTGSAWVTESSTNPGAHLLQWFRGIKDENGKLIAGYGMDDDEIDIPALQAFMVHCAANNYSYSHYQTDARGRLETANAIARAGFGAVSRETGRTGVVWAAQGQPIGGVVNMATIKKGRFEVSYNLYNAADGIEATYFDRTTWAPATIRVPAPGVHPDAMLNPAQIQLEGVTEEAHAAELTRWHMGQSLYQFKDITYGTDEEHLAYKRMDVLSLSHDLTQWGYSGRLVGLDGNTVTLNEPVPAGATPHIGIRVLGEKVYRVMRVASFTGEPRNTLTLLDPWPADAPAPGADRPARDYVWTYDFKATPGYRVRVVGKTMESDGKGASVAVVPESPEFWTYVKTGEYTPPKGGSLLNTLPKASNVRVSEVQVVTGDVIHTELSVLFDIKGQAARSVVFAGISGTEIRPVAETVTNQVRFRIGSAGTYTILVRPYSVDGIAGEAASTTYTTTGADIPPPPFDWFTVTVEPGGLRRYAWGYNQFQPADLAGAEIRFTSGTVSEPAWESMTPLGQDGFFTSAFESDVPNSGEWTFAIRARNTAGQLSTATYAHETLTRNVGETITEHEDQISDLDAARHQLLADFARLGEQVDTVAAQAAAEAVALNQRADGLRTDLDTTIAEVSTLASTTDELGTELTRVESQSIERDTATTATLALLGAKNAAGTAFVLDQSKVQVAPGETLAQWRSSIQGSFQSQSSRIDNEVQARQTADAAHTAAIQAAQSTANNAATKAELASAQNTLAAADQAITSDINLMQVSLGPAMNLVQQPVFREPNDSGDWAVYTGSAEVTTSTGAGHPTEPRVLRITAQGTSNLTVHEAGNRIPVVPGEKMALAFDAYTNFPNRGSYTLGLWFRRANGSQIGSTDQHGITPMQGHTDWRTHVGEVTVPAEAVDVQPALRLLSPQVGDRVWTTRIQVKRQDISAALNAQDLALVKTTVSQQGDTLTVHAQRMDRQQTEIEGKASTGYVQLVEGKAEAAGNSASANQLAIQGLSATVGGQSAQITQAMEVAASASSAVATMANPGFEGGNTGWELAGGAQIIGSNSRTGAYALRISSSGSALNTQKIYDIRGGQNFRIGAWLRYTAERPNEWLRVAARCYAANGAYLRDKFLHVLPTEISTSYQRFVANGTFESDVAFVRVRVATAAGHTSGTWLVDDVFFEPVTNTLADVLTSYTLAMNAAGKFAGVKYLNDGTVSNAQFLFDNFDFITEDGAFQITGGRTITRSNGFMRVEGKPFGQNNEMVVWYGPEQSNLANCRRSNAISYETNTGLHYAKGAMFAGTITAGGQTLAENATVYTTGPFGTNGGPIVVNASFSHARRQLAGMNAQGKNTITAGSGSTSATLQLWRSIGGAAWQLVASTNITGTFVINSDPAPDVQDQAFWDLVGAINYTDNAGGTATRNYELRVSNIQFRSVSISGPAPVPTPTNSRALGVLTAE